jgi:hypothetical protein
MTAIAIPPGFGYSFASSRGQGVSREADRLQELLIESREDRRYSIILGWRDQLADDVREVLEDCSDAGWDGYHASPINPFSAFQCIRLIELLPEGLLAPDIVPEPDGSIGLEWQNASNATLIVSIGEHQIDFAEIAENKTRTTGVRSFSNEISQDVLDILARHFALERSAA